MLDRCQRPTQPGEPLQRTSPQDLDKAVARAVQAVADVDRLITRIHRRLAQA